MGATYPASTAPRFLVTIGGTEFHEYDGTVSDVVVDTTADGADRCSVTLINPFDHEQGSFADLDWDAFEPGTAIEISVGYGEGSGSTEAVFIGSVESIEPDFAQQGPPSVTITGYGPLREMMKGTNSESWEETTIGDVVSSIAGDYVEGVELEAADVELTRVFQDDRSDYRFVQQLAAKYGYDFFSSLGTAHFRPKDGGESLGDPVAELFYGETLESFSAELKPPDHGEVEVRHWDPNAKEGIVGSASNDDGTGKRVYRLPVESASEAESVARAKLGAQRIDGLGHTFGIPSIVAGTIVSLTGLGSKFTKKYYTTRATHRIGESGYRMSFEVTRTEQ